MNDPMPEGFDIHVKTYEETIPLLIKNEVEYISFDHDLGTEKTGYDIASWIEKSAFAGTLDPIGWKVHSANPVGAKNIEVAMRQADKYWAQQ